MRYEGKFVFYKYRVVTPYFDCLHEMKPCYEFYPAGIDTKITKSNDNVSTLMLFWWACDLNEVWQSYTDIMKMNPCYEGLKEIRADVDDPLLFLLDRSSYVFLGYSIGLLPLILIVLWNETLFMKVWKKSELMSMRYEGKCCVLE